MEIKYFLAKLFIPLIKRNVSTKNKAIIGKLNFLLKFDRLGPYKNNEDFVLCLIVLSKHFLAKLFIPLIKRKLSPQF